MAIVTRTREGIKAFVSRNKVGWFNRPVGDPDVLILALFLRFIALLGLIVRFGLNKATYVDGSFLLVRVSLLVFFLYFCSLLFTRSVKRESFLSNTSKWTQVTVDILSFSFLYFLTKDIQSEIFVLYFLPLFIAVEYFSLVETLGVLAFTSLAFAVALLAISLRFGGHPEQWLWKVLFPRQLFFLTFTGAFLYRSRFRVSHDLRQQQKSLASLLEHVEDGVYVIDAQYGLLFINYTLTQRHGDYFYGQKCFSFFLRTDAPCEGCPCTAMLGAYKDHGAHKIVQQFCIDRDGQQYLAEMTLSPVFSDSGEPTKFVGLVRNLSERYQLGQQLEQYLHHAEQAAEVFSRELRWKNELLNRQLASVFSASLAAVGSDRQETLSRMLQVTAEMLGCQAGALRLIGKNSEGRDSLVLQQAYGYSAIWEERRRFLDLDDRSIAMECFLSKQPQIWRDVQDGSAGRGLHEAYFAKQIGLHSMACFPLFLRGQGVGTLSLYRPTVREFTPDEVRLGQSITNYMAITIENFHLYEDKSAQAAERQRWLDAIHEVGVQLAGFESLDVLMQLAVQITKDRLNSEVSSIFLLEDERLRKKATAGVEPYWFAEESYGIGEGITGSCLVTANGTKYGRPVLDNAVDLDPQVVKKHLRKYQGKLKSGQVKHLISVPLNGREGPFGVLRVVNKLDEDGQLCETGFVEGDVNLLNTIACEVAIAVEKARLLEEAQQHVEELYQLQQSSQALLSSLDLQGVLDRIAALAADLAGADCAEVILLDEDDGLVVGAHSSQDLASLPGKPRPDGRTRQVIETGVPVIFDEVSHDGIHDPALVAEGVRSYAGIPITGQERVLGVLFVFSLRPHAFREKIPLLKAFASQAAIAIQNSKLYELEQDRRRLAETLRETSEVVGSALNLERVLALILDQVRRVVAYDTASVQLLTGDKLEIIACRGFDRPDRVLQLTFPVDLNFPNYHVVVNKKPYIVDNVRSRYPHFQDEYYEAIHIRSWLGVPLLFKGHVIGMMSLDSKTIGYYSQEHGQLAMAFANQAAMAIENARLYEKVQSRLAESTALVEVSKSLLQVSKVQDLLQLIIDSAVNVIGPAEGGMIHLLDKDTRKLLPKACSGADRASVERATLMEMGQGIAGHVIEKLETMNVPDVSINPQFDESARASYFNSLLVAPMYVGRGEKRIGTLSVHSKVVGAFAASHERLLTTFASQAATAIANAELFGVRQQKREQLQGILEVYKDFDVDIGMDTLLRRIALAAGDIMGFDVVALKITDPTGQDLIIQTRQAVEESGEEWRSRMVKHTVSIDEIMGLMHEDYRISHLYVIRQRHDLWARIERWYTDIVDSDGQTEAQRFPEFAVLVPLETQDERLIGALVLGKPRQPWPLSSAQDDIQVAEIFAGVATAALENARLYQAVQQELTERKRAEKEIQQRTAQLEALREVGLELTAELDLSILLHSIVSQAVELLGGTSGGFYLYRQDRDVIEWAVAVGEHPVSVGNVLHRGGGVAGKVWETGEPLIVDDYQHWEGRAAIYDGLPIKAVVGVPVRWGEEFLGVLIVDSKADAPGTFYLDDIELLNLFATQSAIAIRNARLFSSVQELKEFNENIVQGMEGGVLMEDAEGCIMFVNPKMGTMLSCSPARLVGQHWSKIVPPVWVEKVAEERRKYPQGGKGRYEAALLRVDGTEIPVAINATPLFENGKFTGVLTVFTDIRETKRRLEDELHEAMNFFHGGVMCGIEAAKYRLGQGQYDLAKAELEQIWRASRHTYSELGNILLDLTDPVLEKQGLGPALERYAGLVARDLVSVKADYEGRLRPGVEHALLRIAQGAITNAIRHAELEQVPGGKVLVRLTREEESIKLSIKDNGKGFDVKIMDRYTQAFGLVRMQEWAKALSTTLQVESAPGKGTRVMVTIPIEETVDA